MKTLQGYFKVQTVSISLLLFICFYLFTNYIYHNISQRESEHISEAISQQVFASMYQVMRKGWSREELRDFLSSVEESFADASYKVDIHRSPVVEAQFGSIEQTPLTALQRTVLVSGIKQRYSEGEITHLITPIMAKNECLQCHHAAKEGDVMGIISTEYDQSRVRSDAQQQFWLLTLLLLPLVVVLSIVMAGRAFGRVQRSIDAFREKIRSVNSVKEFKRINVKTLRPSGFSEIDAIVAEFDQLALQLRDVAVDKEILEFEVKLLDKFIITSEVVRDWKEHIKTLLHDINSVMSVYALITIFETKDGSCDIEIFWSGKPDEASRLYMEEVAFKMLQEHPMMQMNSRTVVHNVSNEDHCITGLKRDDIDHESKSLLLDAPKIGGIVGLGMQTKLSRDSIFTIVIDSVLTTLINLVGSIKAINKYTDTLEYYATRDPLTGLFNQRVFRDLLDYETKRAFRHEHPFGLLVLDCDNFKPVNDTYGHAFGDLFLREFADLLERSKRDEDILARYGGDEFVMIIPESDQSQVYAIAKKLQESINAFMVSAPNGLDVYVSVSIGIALFPKHAQKPKELFNVADAMMYRGKEEGKNAVRMPDEEDIEAISAANNDKALLVLDAIKSERIIPFFQPIMSLENDGIEIHELLMRIDLDNTTISAGSFIEKAESMGVMHQMDYIVIEKAFAHIRTTGYKGTLFINLSPKALIVNEFIGKINELVLRYGIDKSHIVFEITERETVKSFALLEKFVYNLKLEGYRFAIDDFGSGFSSFHYIKKFPIDFIKIDGEFIVNMSNDAKDLAFVKSIVALSKELGVKTVAEFVESEEVLRDLRLIGIDYVQGYHVGKPAAAFHA
ncbi:MAG: bifunctional diguanylate cyclase/phosphodiesterase [Campylobacterales bacterium]|nr:bifunctional diguanylate cyclase/phosphodiesterase [Campylobacterales bacterium]